MSRPFWGVEVEAALGACTVALAWVKPGGRAFRQTEAKAALATCTVAMAGGGGGGGGQPSGGSRGGGRSGGRGGRAAGTAAAMHVEKLETRERRVPPPLGLDTVQFLRAASAGMGIGPARAMVSAEWLYTSGIISYPRCNFHAPTCADVPVTCLDFAKSSWCREGNLKFTGLIVNIVLGSFQDRVKPLRQDL